MRSWDSGFFHDRDFQDRGIARSLDSGFQQDQDIGLISKLGVFLAPGMYLILAAKKTLRGNVSIWF